MARLGYGEGTIVELKARKRWRVAVMMGDGRRVYRIARTPKEAERIRRQLVEARELDLDPTRQTLAAFLRSWIAGLRDARNARVRPRTIDHYDLVVERHIIPALGSLKLSAVTARRVQAWLDADPGSPRTVHHHRAVLRRALNVAVKQRLLAWNPAAVVELPSVTGEKARPLDLEEARRLLEVTRDDRLHALWRLALVTGLREGELLGLAWDDIEPGAIVVRLQLQRLIDPAERELARAEGRKPRGSWVRSGPKAARRLARVAIDPDTAAVLEVHRRAMAAERTSAWEYFGLVFTTPKGQPIHQSEALRHFHEACDRAGIPRRRIHDLRHTSAHLMADLGVPQETRKARMGHSTDAMAELYGGASETRDRAAVERLVEGLSR